MLANTYPAGFVLLVSDVKGALVIPANAEVWKLPLCILAIMP